MKRICFCLGLLFFSAVYTYAQSLYTAKYYIEQGRYLDAAKQLRPLADGGDAEAQYLAAKLFFEGKGVQKNEQQGIKYVTLSADQGYEYAIEYLVCHYGREESTFDKAFLIAKKYTDKYPYLKKKNIGVILAKLYITGCGTAKNEALGWDLLEDNNDFSNVMENKKWATDYWDFKRRQAGYASMEDYADYLLSTESSSGVDLLNHLKMLHGSDFESYYETLAQEGNAFAMAIVAKKNYDNGYSSIASRWIEKATAAGSLYGKKLAEEINYVPTEYKNVNYTASIQNFGISRVRREYRYTIIDVLYTNPGYYDWITISPDIYLSANGKRCKLVKSSEDLNRRITVTKQKTHSITLTFEAIPETCNSFDMIAPGTNGITWKKITILPNIVVPNDIYFIFGTKNELSKLGVLTKSGSIDCSNIFAFTKGDMRIEKQIKTYSKIARLLTSHPIGSYSIERNLRGEAIIVISNPNSFWGESKYCVIQTN